MKSRSRILPGLSALFVLFLASSFACRSAAPGPEKARRLVLVSFDGLGENLLEKWLEQPGVTTPGGLQGMVNFGLRAESVRMVNPTLTAVNHASLITGALPSQTGIVNNSFHVPGDPITRRVNGFSAPNGAQTLWERARKAGIRTGVLLWPGCDGTTEERSGDFGLVWPDRPAASPRIHRLDPEKGHPETGVKSEDGVAAVSWEVRPGGKTGGYSFMVAVCDQTPDGHPAFDAVGVRGESGQWQFYSARDWFELKPEISRSGSESSIRSVGWCRILHLDRQTGSLRLYTGEFNTLKAYPEAFRSKILEIAGPWPGTPDGKNLADWWLDEGEGIDLDTYVEQVERLDRYLDSIATWVMENEDFGLLITYHPSPDEYEHAALIVDPKQWAYSPGTAFAAEKAMERIGRSADRSTARLFEGIDPSQDTLVVVSDHGHLPIHDEVLLNEALVEAGLITTTTSRGRQRIALDSPMAVFTAGACGHLYLNLEGREEGGIVSPEEASGLLRRAARVLADLNDEGRNVVEKIVPRDQLGSFGLDHPNSGDLVIFLEPGYTASSRIETPVIRPTRYYGQHGYLNHYDDLRGIFLARGGPVKAGPIGPVEAVDIAGRVARWLGISPAP